MTKDPRRGAAGEVRRGEHGALGHRLEFIIGDARERGILSPSIEQSVDPHLQLAVADAWIDTVGLADPYRLHLGVLARESLQHIVDGHMGRGAQEDPLVIGDELQDELADRVGLAGARGALEKGEVLGAERLLHEFPLLAGAVPVRVVKEEPIFVSDVHGYNKRPARPVGVFAEHEQAPVMRERSVLEPIHGV